MGLPYEKIGNSTFEKSPDYKLNESILIDHLYSFLETKDFSELQKHTRTIDFTTKNSLFKIPYQITLTPNLNKDIGIGYRIKMVFLLKVVIIVAIVGAFFARLSIQEFLFFEFILTSVFYIINLVLIDSSIKKLITNFASAVPYIVNNEDDPETSSWVNDSSRCPACGEPLPETVSQCPSCKLYIPTKRGFKQYNPNEHKEAKQPPQNIKYTFIEKEKEK